MQHSAVTDVTGLIKGVYKFQLTVTDNNGATGTDIIAGNGECCCQYYRLLLMPGPDQSITLPVNTATLSGSGSDADGTVVSYSWTQISGPIRI